MNCETARRSVVIGTGWLRGRRARRHVSECSDCQKWLSEIRDMERVLSGVGAHPMPAVVSERLVAAARTTVDAPDPRRLKVRRTLLLAAGFVLATVIGFTAWGPGGRSVAQADLRRALSKVEIVHITGLKEADADGGPVAMAYQEDKWLQADPPAFYERNAPAPGAPAAIQPYTVAGDAGHTYWYFPGKGNRATLVRGMAKGLVDEIMGIVHPGTDQDARWRVTGKDAIDGREMDVLTSVDGTTEITVDPKSLLTYRYRHYDADSKKLLDDLRLDYDATPPSGVFEWKPPAGARVVDKRHR